MRILVIEDSQRLSGLLTQGLTEEHYQVEVAADGVSGLEKARDGDFDLLLLDLGLPDMDGLEVVTQLRQSRSDVPVIVITARDCVQQRISVLDGGADDYLTKPFVFGELLARIRAVMRRPGSRSGPVLRYENLKLDPSKGHAYCDNTRLNLSAREFQLLKYFMENKSVVLSRTQIHEAVWHTEYDGTSNVVDVYVNYVRNKLRASGHGQIIHTARGRGYYFGARDSFSQ